LKIGFDVDDVLCDLLTPWLDSYNAEFGTTWTPAQLTQWEIWLDLGGREEDVYRHLRPSLYDVAKPHEGALATVEAIRELGHQVVFLTSCPDVAHFHAKQYWMHRHGFSARYENEVIPFGKAFRFKKKSEYLTHFLLDDAAPNVEGRKGGVLMRRPHNRTAPFTGPVVETLEAFANHVWQYGAVHA
jgi:5'(3')-deoxyribonucleotidase